MFLVYTRFLNQCVFDVILGLASDMNEVIELIWNYSRMKATVFEQNYEDCITNEDIIILKVSQDEYATLEDLYEEYQEELEKENYEKHFGNWKPEIFYANFWYGIIDAEDDIIFSEKDCNLIKTIIENGQRVS